MKTVQIGITLSEEDMKRLHDRRRAMPKIPPVATLARSILSSALAGWDPWRDPPPVLSPALVKACRQNIEDQGAIEGDECTQIMAYLGAVLEWQGDKAAAPKPASDGWFTEEPVRT